MIVQVTEYGREIYGQYADAIYKYHFSKMFAEGEKLPKAYLPIVAKMLSPGCDVKKKKKRNAGACSAGEKRVEQKSDKCLFFTWRLLCD